MSKSRVVGASIFWTRSALPGVPLTLSISITAAVAPQCAAVLNSAEKRRCNSDEQDHDHYLYLRRSRHFLSLYPDLREHFRGRLINGRRSRPKSDRTRPPCLCKHPGRLPLRIPLSNPSPPLRASSVPAMPEVAAQTEKHDTALTSTPIGSYSARRPCAFDC